MAEQAKSKVEQAKSNLEYGITTPTVSIVADAYAEIPTSYVLEGNSLVPVVKVSTRRFGIIGDTTSTNYERMLNLEQFFDQNFVREVQIGRRQVIYEQVLKMKYVYLKSTSGCGGPQGILDGNSPCLTHFRIFENMITFRQIANELMNPICRAEACRGQRVTLPRIDNIVEFMGVGGSLPAHFLGSLVLRKELNLASKYPLLTFVVGPIKPLTNSSHERAISFALEAALAKFIQDQLYDKGTRIIILNQEYKDKDEDHGHADFLNAISIAHGSQQADIADLVTSISRDEVGYVLGIFSRKVEGKPITVKPLIPIVKPRQECGPLDVSGIVPWINEVRDSIEKEKKANIVAASLSGPFHRSGSIIDVINDVKRSVSAMGSNGEAKAYYIITDHAGTPIYHKYSNGCVGLFLLTVVATMPIDELWSEAVKAYGSDIVNKLYNRIYDICKMVEDVTGYQYWQCKK